MSTQSCRCLNSNMKQRTRLRSVIKLQYYTRSDHQTAREVEYRYPPRNPWLYQGFRLLLGIDEKRILFYPFRSSKELLRPLPNLGSTPMLLRPLPNLGSRLHDEAKLFRNCLDLVRHEVLRANISWVVCALHLLQS